MEIIVTMAILTDKMTDSIEIRIEIDLTPGIEITMKEELNMTEMLIEVMMTAEIDIITMIIRDMNKK